jgi:hypothetical protein
MKVSEQSKTIAEAIGCVFFEGTMQELNVDIERSVIEKDAWIFGYVLPLILTDNKVSDQSPVVETTFPFTAFICRQSNEPTIDHRTRDMQTTYDDALKLARSFVHKFSELDSVKSDPKKREYIMVDSHLQNPNTGFDLHLFGVWIQCDFVISEGLTGCEL